MARSRVSILFTRMEGETQIKLNPVCRCVCKRLLDNDNDEPFNLFTCSCGTYGVVSLSGPCSVVSGKHLSRLMETEAQESALKLTLLAHNKVAGWLCCVCVVLWGDFP